MIYLVTGSRNVKSISQVERILMGYFAVKDLLIVGDARGVDSIAAGLADRLFMKVRKFVPDWDRHGKAAGPIRNAQMLDEGPDLVIAFWDGSSRGTKNTIDGALSRKIETHVHFLD